jgi:predicted dehydrogenase
MAQKLRVGIIGIGAIAELIARAIGELPDAELAGGSCRTREKGERFAARFGCGWFADYQQMLDQIRPDVAVCCTPSGAHLEPLLTCAQRGVHVLCEKPLEICVERCRTMITAANSGGIMLGGMFPLRFSPPARLVHDAARRGRFGELAAISAVVPWWRDDEYYAPQRWQGTLALDGGGALMNQAIHMIDLLQWIAAAGMPNLPPHENPVDQVFAFTALRAHDREWMEVEDSAVVSLRFRNGAMGQILAATSMFPGSPRRLTVGGRDGTAELVEEQLATFRFRFPESDDDSNRARFNITPSGDAGASNPVSIDHANHRRNIAAFFESVRSGANPDPDATEAAKAVAIIEACYKSAETGKAVAPAPL